MQTQHPITVLNVQYIDTYNDNAKQTKKREKRNNNNNYSLLLLLYLYARERVGFLPLNIFICFPP